MNYRMLWHLLSIILMIEAALLLLPMLVALIYGEDLMPYLLTIALLLVLAAPGALKKPKNQRIFAKEGFVCVAGAWILMSAFGALPFVIGGDIPNYVDAFFETASGFTTTGASILREIEPLHKGILFWRSFTHMIGGMGVLVFMLAILPSTDGRTMHLLRAEVPGPQKGKLVPKMRDTAMILYAIYLSLTVLTILALLCTGMDLYDASVNAFGCAGTGGFSVKNASIGAYHNPAAEWIMAIAMLLFGVNFNLYFFLLTKRFAEVKKNEELRVYLVLCFVSTAIISFNTWQSVKSIGGSVGDCIRNAFFQVTTIVSTAGFSTVDFDLWPALSKSILVILMLTGACAGSTAGGLKLSRVMILVKNTFREIKHILRPNSVSVVRLDGDPIPEETCRSAANYFSLWFLFLVSSILLISIDGFDPLTNITAALACINNVGPGLAGVGPTQNFADYSIFSKIVLSLDMLTGRLEIMPLLIFFSPTTWKNR